MEKNICKIKIGNEQGTGFFCKIPFPNKDNMIPVFITNNHVINDKILKKDDEKISIFIEAQNSKKIGLKNRMKYTNEEYDITIIELQDKDEINNYLELDDAIIDYLINDNNKNDRYLDETVYIIQYPEGKLSVSYGVLDKIYEVKIYNFNHKCSTKGGSSGSPILNITNNKVLGIHKEGHSNKYNKGTFLNYPIKIFIEQNKNKYRGNKHKIIAENIPKKENKQSEIKTSAIKEKKEEIYDNSEEDTITMIYDLEEIRKKNKKIEEDNEKNKASREKENLKIFGVKFVENNKPFFSFFSKNNIKILYKKKEYNFEPYFDIGKIIEDKKVEIKLKGIKDITNKSYMFDGCKNLVSVSNISNWITSKNTDISYMFYECESLKSLPDISNWDTSEVTNMNYIFAGCKSLISLPDISKWNTSKVNYMKYIFYYCESLRSLPDLSKWNISRAKDISCMFSSCVSLYSLPDISNWNTSNVTDMNHLFSNGSSDKINKMNKIFNIYSKLISLPDISRWDTSNVINMECLFSGCESLLSLPDISKWNISKVKDINHMFYACKQLTSLPDISKWNTSNITDMNHSFCHCLSLTSLPNISRWNTSKVTNMKYMFYNCESLSSLPDISKWNVSKVTEFHGMFHGCRSLPSSSFNNIKEWSPDLFDEDTSCVIF